MKLKELKPDDYIIYVDLDGVLADLHKMMKEITGHDLSDDNTYDQKAWNEFIEYRKKGNKTFEIFDKLPDADQLWNYIKKYKPQILSATGKHMEKDTAKEKRAWVKKNISGYGKINLVMASGQKAKYAWPDSILIDDRMKSIAPWTKRGGIGILHKSAADTIKQLKKMGL